MPKVCKIRSAFQRQFKVSIIGCGNVGATTAYAILMDSTPTELVLVSRREEQSRGLMLDFEHSLPFFDYTKITATDDYSACADSHLIIITAGAKQKEGETRLDLIQKNRKIFQDMIPKLAKVAPDSILLIVSNPVDALTYEATKLSGFPTSRVFGTGTMLDTSRFRFHISQRLCLSSKSIDAYILGEHGDSSFPVLSSANVAGKSLFEFEGFDKKTAEECYEETKNAAYRIINDIGYTCYSIATVLKEVVNHIFHHSRIVLPLSVVLDDYYGHSDVALSIPCILDNSGVAEMIEIPLNAREHKQLAHSVDVLKQHIHS